MCRLMNALIPAWEFLFFISFNRPFYTLLSAPNHVKELTRSQQEASDPQPLVSLLSLIGDLKQVKQDSVLAPSS